MHRTRTPLDKDMTQAHHLRHTLLALACTIAESREREHPPVDWVGAVAVAIAIAAIVFACVEIPARGWLDPLVTPTLALGVAAAVVFVIMELRVAAPLLDVRLFARRGFGAGSLSVTIQFLVTFGVFLLLVQYLQLILGYGPLGSALGLVPALSASVTVLLSTVSLWLGWWPPRGPSWLIRRWRSPAPTARCSPRGWCRSPPTTCAP